MKVSDRRSFIKTISTLALVGCTDSLLKNGVFAAAKELAPPPDLFDASLVDVTFWLQPRTLEMVRPQTGEQLKITYWKDGHINPKGYAEICDLLRDVQEDQVYNMDTQLIDTLWAAQAFVRRYGVNAPLEITSGYRSAKTNRRLIEQGIPAARNSLHMRGQAADFRLPGLHPRVLGELVQGFRTGGVGFYLRIGSKGGWIHADSGPEREWRG